MHTLAVLLVSVHEEKAPRPSSGVATMLPSSLSRLSTSLERQDPTEGIEVKVLKCLLKLVAASLGPETGR